MTIDLPLQVRTLSVDEHAAFLQGRASASFLQTPGWAQVKREWRAESLGWERDGEVVGAGLVLHRDLPGVGGRIRRSLAYLPEGPVIDWDQNDLGSWLRPMAAHLRSVGAFAVRMGPPVVLRRWDAAQIKAGLADDGVRRLGDLSPTVRDRVGSAVVSQLRELGWRPTATSGGFTAGQPQYNFWVPLRDEDGKRRTEDDVLAGMNQLWRRNIRKAAKAGVEVRAATRDSLASDLAAFHELYVHTAGRDAFTPRPAAYFERMFAALGPSTASGTGTTASGTGTTGSGTGTTGSGSGPAAGPSEIRLYLAEHEGDLVAATIWVRVGEHVWYSYGASSTEKRDVRGSNAVQWRMLCDALAADAAVYDLRGITDTLDPDDPHAGLVQFKVGTGGQAVEYAGEWDLPLNRLLHKGFELYLRRR